MTIEWLPDRTFIVEGQTLTATTIYPEIKVTGAINHSKRFGVVLVFVAGHQTGHVYVAATHQAVTEAMDRMQTELMSSIARGVTR